MAGLWVWLKALRWLLTELSGQRSSDASLVRLNRGRKWSDLPRKGPLSIWDLPLPLRVDFTVSFHAQDLLTDTRTFDLNSQYNSH